MEKEKLTFSVTEKYADSLGHLNNITNSLSTVSNQLNVLNSTIYESGITNVISGLSDKFKGLNTLSSILPEISVTDSISPILNLSRNATNAITALNSSTGLLELTSSINSNIEPWYMENIAKSSVISTSVLPNINISRTTSALSSIIGLDNLSSITLHSGITKATELTLFSEKSIYGVNNENFGIHIGIDNETKNILTTSATNLAVVYSELYQSFQSDPLTYINLSPALSKQTSVEYFTSANLIEAISLEEEVCVEEEVLKTQIQYENEISLREFLPKLDNGLYKMWQGAVEAYNSDNTDKIRHFVTSIRELFTHLMHILAPEKEVKNWTSDDSLFHEGRPTRKARLLYICRNISNNPFKKFVNKDVEATLAFIDIFQRGTHKIDPYFTSNHLMTIKSKAEGTLKFLLEIYFKSE